MSPTFVVDASVALKWVLPEVDSERAMGLVGRASLKAPELLAVECANALWLRARRQEITPVEARTAYADLLTVPIAWVSDRSLALGALTLAADLDHPAYDCTYLALAIEAAAVVVTADRRFAAAARRQASLAERVVLLAEIAA